MSSRSATICMASVSMPWWRLLTSCRIGMSELRPGPSLSTRAVTSARSCSCCVTSIGVLPYASSFLTLAISVCGSTGFDDVRVVVNDQDLGHHALPLSLAVPHGATGRCAMGNGKRQRECVVPKTVIVDDDPDMVEAG